MNEPVTLFAENDMERYKRLLKLEQEQKDSNDRGKGNTFNEDLGLN